MNDTWFGNDADGVSEMCVSYKRADFYLSVLHTF